MNHVMYEDDICLMAPSAIGLREMLDVCLTLDIFSFKVQKKSLLFSKHCILIMAASILINVGTLSKPNDCLSNLAGKSLYYWFFYSILTP